MFEEANGTGGAGGEANSTSEGVDAAAKALELKNKTVVEEETEEETEETSEDLSAEELNQAKSLFKLLNNKDTALSTLETLVKASGLDLTKATVAEKKEVAKTIKDIVKDGLGDEYQFLNERLADVIEKAVSQLVDEKTKDIREGRENDKVERLKNTIDTAQKNVLSSYEKVPDKVMIEANRILTAGELTPHEKSDPEKFFKSLLLAAADNLDVPLKKKVNDNTNDKRERNRTDATARLASRNSSSSEGTEVKEFKSKKEAIADAERQVLAALGSPKG